MSQKSYASLGNPVGWFAVALSTELPAGTVQPRMFMGQEIVLFRTASGRASATAAYCPHLGAHLGHSGAVDGECLRCDFHGFQYDGNGTCVATGYKTRPPKAARLRSWPVRELYGIIFLYHDPAQGPPRWELPVLDLEGWSPLIFHRFSFRGHPQEIAENALDWGHLLYVHHLHDVRLDGEIKFSKECLNARNLSKRKFKWLKQDLDAEFEMTLSGLGMSISDTRIPVFGLRLRQLYFATATAPEQVELLVGVTVQESAFPLGQSLLATPLRKAAARLAAHGMLAALKKEVHKDINIWQHKQFLSQPALAEGDGPIGLYRKWVRQFYTEAMP